MRWPLHTSLTTNISPRISGMYDDSFLTVMRPLNAMTCVMLDPNPQYKRRPCINDMLTISICISFTSRYFSTLPQSSAHVG